MCLLDNREVKAGWQPLKDSVSGLFQKHGAEIVSSRRWDERRLAYPIKGQQRATFLLTYFKASTQQVSGIRRDLQFKESVLRSMVLQCEEVPQQAFEPEAEFDVNAIPLDDKPEAKAAPEAAEPADEPAAAAEAAAPDDDAGEADAADKAAADADQKEES